jgi:hypothetical protein
MIEIRIVIGERTIDCWCLLKRLVSRRPVVMTAGALVLVFGTLTAAAQIERPEPLMPGAPARAQDINDRFDRLYGAVDDLNANLASLRSQGLTSDRVVTITASLDGAAAVNGGASVPTACPDGYNLLSFGLTLVEHTDNGVDGWDLGGTYGCRADDNALVAHLENYQNGSPNTTIECTGLCMNVTPR